MSEKFAHLVYGLPVLRPATHGSWDALAESRNRFVLATIAVHADEDGCCRVDVPTLSGWTGYSSQAVVNAIQASREQGLLTSTYASGGSAPLYRLVEDELVRQQSEVPGGGKSVDVGALVDFGLPEATVRRLADAGWDTVESIGAELAVFEEQDEATKSRGLASFLGVPGVGDGKATQIVVAYNAFKSTSGAASLRR